MGPFCQNFGNFFFFFFVEKWALSVFRFSSYLPSWQKSENTNPPFLRKTSNWWTNRQTDNGNFIGLSVGQGSNNIVNNGMKSKIFLFYLFNSYENLNFSRYGAQNKIQIVCKKNKNINHFYIYPTSMNR